MDCRVNSSQRWLILKILSVHSLNSWWYQNFYSSSLCDYLSTYLFNDLIQFPSSLFFAFIYVELLSRVKSNVDYKSTLIARHTLGHNFSLRHCFYHSRPRNNMKIISGNFSCLFHPRSSFSTFYLSPCRAMSWISKQIRTESKEVHFVASI